MSLYSKKPQNNLDLFWGVVFVYGGLWEKRFRLPSNNRIMPIGDESNTGLPWIISKLCRSQLHGSNLLLIWLSATLFHTTYRYNQSTLNGVANINYLLSRFCKERIFASTLHESAPSLARWLI